MVLQKRKIGLLNFTAAAGIELDAVLLLYLIAAADPQDPVSRWCLQLPLHLLHVAHLRDLSKFG